ncbi:Glutathione-regulated potassium-efflux system protein KefB [bioreactor metagenome]|uniref:Glutathione-regulated potassium-efflux system protein KefB n=1 Tax=bioreactor metagenome TaxID=1076179 RepID=A0A644YW81_9ZZZZ
MFFGGVRVIPWLLERVAHMHSRELFILVVLVITLGTALGAAELFGVSLALGAFLAGAIISQSHLSHQVGADVFSFREAFSVLFFVSVGMLVNPVFLWQNLGQVLGLTALVVFGKLLIVIVMAMFFPQPLRTFLVIAIGLSQVGEFSFILGQGGLSLGLLSVEQYSLILAASLFSITINPFMYRLVDPLERLLSKVPVFSKRAQKRLPTPLPAEEKIKDHVVVVGYDRIGKHLVDVLTSLKIPMIVIEEDIDRIVELQEQAIPALYGDASNSEVLDQTHLEKAKLLVSTVPDETATAMIVSKARTLSPTLSIMARSSSQEGVIELEKMGANYVVLPELEGGLELIHNALLELKFPLQEVHAYTQAVRRDHYNLENISNEEHRSLDDLLAAFKGIEISWMNLEADSPLIGQTLAEAGIRSKTGASLVALIREGQLLANPKSQTIFLAGDRLGFIGESPQIESVRKLILAEIQAETQA